MGQPCLAVGLIQFNYGQSELRWRTEEECVSSVKYQPYWPLGEKILSYDFWASLLVRGRCAMQQLIIKVSVVPPVPQ